MSTALNASKMEAGASKKPSPSSARRKSKSSSSTSKSPPGGKDKDSTDDSVAAEEEEDEEEEEDLEVLFIDILRRIRSDVVWLVFAKWPVRFYFFCVSVFFGGFAQKFLDWFLACQLGWYEVPCRDDTSLFTMPFIYEMTAVSGMARSESFLSLDYGHYAFGVFFTLVYGSTVFAPIYLIFKSFKSYKARARRLLREERTPQKPVKRKRKRN